MFFQEFDSETGFNCKRMLLLWNCSGEDLALPSLFIRIRVKFAQESLAHTLFPSGLYNNTKIILESGLVAEFLNVLHGVDESRKLLSEYQLAYLKHCLPSQCLTIFSGIVGRM